MKCFVKHLGAQSRFFFSLFMFLCCFPFCFPVVLSYCIPRCTTPVFGSKSSSQSLKKWWLRTCAHLQKKVFHKKSVIFHISFDLYTDSILKQINKLKNINICFSTFHFSLLFPVLFPHCASLLWTPLHYSVVGSKSSSQSLKKWWLRTCAHLKNISKKICDFIFFR